VGASSVVRASAVDGPPASVEAALSGFTESID
jgi:hypothetical protein